MRQNKNIQYATLLENLWIGNILKSDFDLLEIQLLNQTHFKLPRWCIHNILHLHSTCSSHQTTQLQIYEQFKTVVALFLTES
jgi:hypothetical protein